MRQVSFQMLMGLRRKQNRRLTHRGSQTSKNDEYSRFFHDFLPLSFGKNGWEKKEGI